MTLWALAAQWVLAAWVAWVPAAWALVVWALETSTARCRWVGRWVGRWVVAWEEVAWEVLGRCRPCQLELCPFNPRSQW
jgi:hypothetical protein